MQADVFRVDSNDPESRSKLNGLLNDFGAYLPECLCGNFSQLIENLVWRETASARETDGDIALQVFLDLGEGDEVLLATIRTGEFSAVSHSELYAPYPAISSAMETGITDHFWTTAELIA
jgi:hypothetical protein